MVVTLRSAAALLVTISALGCGGSEPPLPTPTSAQGTEWVSRYLDELLDIMEAESVHSKSIDWAHLRAEVFATAAAAQTIPAAYPAIGLALQSLNDFESFYTARSGRRVGPSPEPACVAGPEPVPAVPDGIGYVRVESCACEGIAEANQFAEWIQQAIRAADRPGLVGWIVDLRAVGGGNMWPMMAGLGPVLGEGIVGWIVYNNREYEREYRDGAALSLGEAFARVAAPYTLREPFPKVAVLTGGLTNSAGEATAVWFKGRPGARSFGTPTCGHHHLLQSFQMSDGALLTLKTANNADRLKRSYAGPDSPDEQYADPAHAVNRAIEWLQNGG